jgi:hypothetical protein
MINVKCANSFKKWLFTEPYYERIYDIIGRPRPSDVTLLDGLQILNKYSDKPFSTNIKLGCYHIINFSYKPKNIEIGDIPSKSWNYNFRDTIELMQKINQYNLFTSNLEYNATIPTYYVMIPNEKMFDSVFSELNCIQNFSFTTSVSNKFQFKNTRTNIYQNFKEINNMILRLDDSDRKFSTKLYISCINECPIDGKLPNDYIVDRLIELNNLKVDNMCLSDTCGSLNSNDFKYIIKKLLYTGVNSNNLSLHIRVNPNNEENAEKIFHIALDHGIKNFNASCFAICQDAMGRHRKFPNLANDLSYELYYKFLKSYIVSKTD